MATSGIGAREPKDRDERHQRTSTTAWPQPPPGDQGVVAPGPGLLEAHCSRDGYNSIPSRDTLPLAPRSCGRHSWIRMTPKMGSPLRQASPRPFERAEQDRVR